MAHGFKAMGRNTSFVSRKELAWHQLGKTVDAMTSAEAIELAGMNFRVGLAPLYAGVQPISLNETYDNDTVIRAGKGNDVKFFNAREVQGNFATYRKDTGALFGVVGSRYHVVQNIDAFDFFDDIIGQGHAAYETAGALGNGEKIFITAKLPDTIQVKGDPIDQYLLLTMAHDGSGAIKALFTPIRVVCNNTLSMALRGSHNAVSIRHTKSAKDKLNAAHEVLGIVKHQSENLSDIFNSFANSRMEDIAIKNVIKDAFGFKEDEKGNFTTKAANILNNVLEYHEIGVGQENIRGTKWGVLNAITGFQQNTKKYKSIESQFDSIYSKDSARIRQKAFNNLLQL